MASAGWRAVRPLVLLLLWRLELKVKGVVEVVGGRGC